MEPDRTPEKPSLKGLNILLVEDDYLLAQDTANVLRRAGASVLGPYANEIGALRVLRSDVLVSCALLDIQLQNEPCFTIAHHLQRREIPFLFLTGMNPALIPSSYAAHRTLCKPFDLGLLAMAMRSLLNARRYH